LNDELPWAISAGTTRHRRSHNHRRAFARLPCASLRRIDAGVDREQVRNGTARESTGIA